MAHMAPDPEIPDPTPPPQEDPSQEVVPEPDLVEGDDLAHEAPEMVGEPEIAD